LKMIRNAVFHLKAALRLPCLAHTRAGTVFFYGYVMHTRTYTRIRSLLHKQIHLKRWKKIDWCIRYRYSSDVDIAATNYDWS